jgi:GNAT superfamily N-acetyltransferase
MSQISLERAVDAFGYGFTFIRSFAHPFEYVRVGPLRVMRDAPRRKGPYRTQEIIVYGIEPDEAVEAIRTYGTDQRYAVCVIYGLDQSDEEIKEAYKARGFRCHHRERFMACALNEAQTTVPEPLPVQRVTTSEEAQRVAKAARSRQILPKHIGVDDAPLRLYWVEDGETPVGWVRSIRALPEATSVSNMYVHPDHRCRGLGKALMSRMLRDDRVSGADYSVLLASHAGAMLYPNLGYQEIGSLRVFTPT